VKLNRTLRLCFILIASQLLVGCGSPGNLTASASPNTAALNGNWYITGNRQLVQYPFITVALIVNGNQIYAVGDMVVTCTNWPGSANGGYFTASGEISPDGTFHLGNYSLGGMPTSAHVQLEIDGSVPKNGSGTWSGTYSLADPTGYTDCLVNQTASFTATALAPINATYGGILIGSSGNLTVHATIAQVAGVTVSGPGTAYSYLPLNGTITVSGSPCFTHGTSPSPNNGGQIEGDFADLGFVMDDGSQLWLEGFVTAPDEAGMNPALALVIGGKCNQNNYQGTLTRQ
jgi:hypothetical protein